jgi:hypothetical protein
MNQQLITTGTTGLGLRWAAVGSFRVMAYAMGGYGCQRYVPEVGWCLFAGGESMPEAVERALCERLGIAYEE